MRSGPSTNTGRPGPSTGRITAAALALALVQAGCSDTDRAEGLARGDRGPEVLEIYRYLHTYGYLPNPALQEHPGWEPAISETPADPSVFDEVLERALVIFQRTHGVPPDGVLNEATLRLMKTPRCGYPDSHARLGGTRSPNFAPDSRWPSGNLTYSFSNYTPDLSAGTVQSSIAGAASRWTAVAPLSLMQVGWGGDIDIGFYAGDHGDIAPFDGPLQTLAHAFYPTYGGDIHFDEAETWTTNGSGIDLESVALHEFGHSLGLGHSSDSNAVMWPYIDGIRRDLGWDDIQGIQTLYLPAPAPISNVSEHCYGFNTVYWTAQPGATYYELHRSFYYNFSNPTVIYSGSETSLFISVGSSDIWYLRAKACNAYGCSDYTWQETARYHTGACL